MTHNNESQLLKTMFDLQGFYFIESGKSDERIIIELGNKRKYKCNFCGKEYEHKYDSNQRTIYAGSLNTNPIYFRYKHVRVNCTDCGIRSEAPPLSDGKKQYTKSVGKTVISYTKHLDNKSAAKLLGITESTLFRIDKESLSELMSDYTKKVPQIKYAGVDEVSIKKRHKYGTVLINHKDSKVIWVEQNRTKSSYQNILKFLKDKLENLEAISMDFWKAYETGTKELFPYCKIIYDRFHLSQILNRHVERERRDYQKKLSDKERKRMKKHFRWVILRRKDNQYNHEHLKELREKNLYLFDMYLLKEKFLSIFDQSLSKEEAEKKFYEWNELLIQTPFKSLKAFAKKVFKRLDDLLNWFDIPISNGKSEGKNNVIKSLLKRAYGYKDFEYFRMKILQKCGYLMD